MTYRYQPLYEDPDYYGDDEQEYYEEEQEDEYSPYGTTNS